MIVCMPFSPRDVSPYPFNPGLKDKTYAGRVLTKSVEEACKLVEANFEYICDVDNTRIFRKRKQMIKMKNIG